MSLISEEAEVDCNVGKLVRSLLVPYVVSVVDTTDSVEAKEPVEPTRLVLSLASVGAELDSGTGELAMSLLGPYVFWVVVTVPPASVVEDTRVESSPPDAELVEALVPEPEEDELAELPDCERSVT